MISPPPWSNKISPAPAPEGPGIPPESPKGRNSQIPFRPSQQRLSIALAFWRGRRRRHYAEEHRILAGFWGASHASVCTRYVASSALEVVVATLDVVYETKRAPALTALLMRVLRHSCETSAASTPLDVVEHGESDGTSCWEALFRQNFPFTLL